MSRLSFIDLSESEDLEYMPSGWSKIPAAPESDGLVIDVSNSKSWVRLRTIQAHANAVTSLSVSRITTAKLGQQGEVVSLDSGESEDILAIISNVH